MVRNSTDTEIHREPVEPKLADIWRPKCSHERSQAGFCRRFEALAEEVRRGNRNLALERTGSLSEHGCAIVLSGSR
jgi:hypothetical protein